ncbi:hypothetical protein IID19_02815 [Patescibacteria group bacterium]|nr:hypothetical protein [Patescibacteria group bacterium]
MSNIFGAFNKKVAGVSDDMRRLHIRSLLNSLIVDSTMNKNGLRAADIAKFCEMTPSGEALTSIYQEFKKSYDGENPDFVKFVRHIIDRPFQNY